MKHYRKNTIRIFSFVLVFCVVFSFTGAVYNRYSHLEKVEAAAVGGSLVSYILSALGAVNVLSNGEVSSVSGSIVDQLEQMVADAMGSGIYTDSNGNYVFSNGFTQSIYEALDGSSDYDVRVISNFVSNNNSIVNADYFSPEFNDRIVSAKASYDNYLVEFIQYRDGSNIFSYGYVYQLPSDFVGLNGVTDSNSIKFIRSNLSTMSVNCTYHICRYNPNSGYYNVSGGSKSVSYIAGYGNSGYQPEGDINGQKFNDIFFLLAPEFNFPNENIGYSFYANRSLLISKDISDMNHSINQDQGIFYNNNGIPSISQTAIENNNWNNIYNNYVQNVAENYYSENGDNPFDQELLRKWMRQYSNNIIASIEAGVDDIEGAITTSNNWLRMIYDKISEINTSGGSGGGCSWDPEDIEYMLNKVNSIDLGQGNTTQQLILIYGLLDDILDAVRERNAPTPDMIDWLDNLPDLDILDTIAKMDIVTNALAACVPMCYLAALGAILGGLSTDPEPIDIEIPFSFNSANGIEVDEAVTIDLTDFESVHTILIAAEVLAYICFLMIASFRLLQLLLDIFSGGG